MEGDNITLHCGSQIMSNHSNFKSRRWFWLLKERKLGNKDLPDQPLMESYFGPTPRRHRPTGFVTWPEHVPPMDMKVVKVNRYSTGRYACAVASLLGTTTYSEITLQNVFVKCEVLHIVADANLLLKKLSALIHRIVNRDLMVAFHPKGPTVLQAHIF